MGPKSFFKAGLADLLSVSLNGPNQLSDEEAASIASKWLHSKSRRSVTNEEVGVEDTFFAGEIDEILIDCS